MSQIGSRTTHESVVRNQDLVTLKQQVAAASDCSISFNSTMNISSLPSITAARNCARSAGLQKLVRRGRNPAAARRRRRRIAPPSPPPCARFRPPSSTRPRPGTQSPPRCVVCAQQGASVCFLNYRLPVGTGGAG